MLKLILLSLALILLTNSCIERRPSVTGHPFLINKEGLIFLPVSTGGKLYYFLLDTGSNQTIINPRYIAPEELLGKTFVKDLYNDSLEVDWGRAGTLTVCNATLEGRNQFIFADLNNYAGILGTDVLTSLMLEMNFKTLKSNVISKHDLTNYHDKIKLKRDPSGKFHLLVTVPDNGPEKEYFLDSGINAFLLTAENNARESSATSVKWRGNAITESFIRRPSSKEIKQKVYYVTNAKVGNYLLKNEIAVFDEKINRNIAGVDMLRRFDQVVLNLGEEELYLKSPSEKTWDIHYHLLLSFVNTTGIRTDGGRIPVITETAEWLWDQNILTGDSVISINGIDILNKPDSFYISDKSSDKKIDTLINGKKIEQSIPSDYVQAVSLLRYFPANLELVLRRKGKDLTLTLPFRTKLPDDGNCYRAYPKTDIDENDRLAEAPFQNTSKGPGPDDVYQIRCPY